MSVLFAPTRIGDLEVPNRFVRSATAESMATETGEVTGKLLDTYRRLASGGVGLIISGVMYVHPWGTTNRLATGIHEDGMVPGLARLVDAVHAEGGRMLFQLGHAGRQTSRKLIGRKPLSASAKHFDTVFMVRPSEMSEGEIRGAIGAFGSAARRAVEAGADGVQLHGAHGYLISQFLSPFFNHRKDAWGDSDEGRFRFLAETVKEVRNALPPGMPLAVKINSNDHLPGWSVTISLAIEYAARLKDLGVDALEVSCGTGCCSSMEIWRGDVPVSDLASCFPAWKRPAVWLALKRAEGRFDAEEGYNLPGAEAIKSSVGGIPVMAVGGFRSFGFMEEAVSKGRTDFVSMCRPFIREPSLVNRFRDGKAERASCASCNRCVAVVGGNKPVRCARAA